MTGRSLFSRPAAALISFAVAAVVACSGGRPEVSRADVDRAKAALEPFKRELKAALLEGLEDGPEAAIVACRDAAPAIASRLTSNDVEMGRTSHKLRNPDNAPADWVKPLLAAYTGGGEDPYLAVTLEDGRIGYVQPIYVQKPCLMCHGPALAPALAEHIAMQYAEDRATGFDEGDFRGLFWVTLPGGSKER
jgi:hypothetical protein